ncbi:binding-protein-dependent transport systems inner membrane component [Xylanimonas cellulosilytica DSM 15894]|uniref:Binding-protein-dependent transport systems inner membrane component n=1 Tax=Xylanimonas cellulosilytica (strain DSM 15894 / JCM 12276 / CECT 5975 / KCTC 9989 / LMG 20990 / NBRC 107835 / XIL07) TaxID=446471 RepID=D1BVD6_XYLCX|nr:binding-protein-dependent transport systems inner membrane component [Xylanimonas cellulosilytica DSM 15894]
MTELEDRPDIAAVRTSLTQIKDTPGTVVFRWFNYTFLTLLSLVTVYPFVNIIAKSFSSDGAIAAGKVNIWPVGFNLTTFQAVVSDSMFWLNYRNTVVYTVVGTMIAMAITTTFAYALSRQNLRGRGPLIGLAVFTMFFSGGLIPNYLLVTQWLGMRNTIWAIVLPGALSVFNLLVMKAFFENFPAELEEAAALDGLSTYGIFFRVVLPLSKAVIATMILFYAVSQWNSWFGAFLYLDDKRMFPVMMYLRNLIASVTGAQEVTGSVDDAVQIGANIQAVTMLLTVLPIICIYPFVQKYFVSGVMLGSVKG